jgi:hypothetical protein
MPAYKRILLKLSGEALMGDDAFGINRATIVRMETGKLQRSLAWECKLLLSLAAVTSFVEWLVALLAWIEQQPITWVCWRQ